MGALADLWKECVRTPNDSGVWEEFLGTQRPLIARIVVRVAHRFGISTADAIDDAVQEVCVKMSTQARLGTHQDLDDTILEPYLKASIANAAHDYFRSQRAKRRDLLVTTPIDDSLAAEFQSPGGTAIERGVLLQEIEHLVEGSARDRQVFFLYYRHGWTAKEISAIPAVGLTQKGVESLVFRMTAAVRERVKQSHPQEGLDKGFSQPST